MTKKLTEVGGLVLMTAMLFVFTVLSQQVKADDGLPDKLAITFYDQVRHFNPKPWYNEHNINYIGVTVNNWTFSNYSNSFYEPTRMIQYEWDKRFNSWSGGFISLAWVNGYSDMQNFITPLMGLRVGPKVGLQGEMTLLPGAVAMGFKIVLSDK